MATLPKPQGAGDTKKVRRMRKKLEGKATGGSISTSVLLRQCRDVGVHVKPLLTPHLERHGRRPTLSAKEARQLVLHSTIGSQAPKAAEIRNLPAVRAVLVIALTGTAAAAAAPPKPEPREDEANGDVKSAPPPAAPAPAAEVAITSNPLDGFSEEFKQKFRLCAGLRISSGGSTAGAGDGGPTILDGDGSGDGGNGNGGGGGGGGWLKSLADALLYAPLGEDREACPAGPFSGGKKRKNAGGHGGGRKKRSKGEARRRRKMVQAGQQRSEEGSGEEGDNADENGAGGAQGNAGEGEGCGDEGYHGDAKEGEEGVTSAVVAAAAAGLGEDDAESSATVMEEANNVGEEDRADGAMDSSSGEEEEEARDEPLLPTMESYILTVAQLRENGFPVPCQTEPGKDEVLTASGLVRVCDEVVLPTAKEAESVTNRVPKLADLEGHVQTQPLSDAGAAEPGGAGGVRVFGLDCEMCVTEAGLELTRITLVDSQHKVLLDELVKPDNNIVDYVTRYSGITPQLLEGVDTRLHQVQAAMLRVVGANDLLVGHSLENDLKALKMVHLRCLDTSLLYPHPKKGRRSSLRYLVSMYLQRTIQTSDKGHNSAEDAIAALELAQLKVSRGPNFGAERSTDSIFDRLQRNHVPSTMIASSEQCRRHVSGAAGAVPSFSDDGVVQSVLKELKGVGEDQRAGTKPPLVWAELEGPKCPTIQEACAAATGGSAGVHTFLGGMDKAGRAAGHERRVARVLDGLPPGVMVFVVSQGVNPELPRKLEKQRKACEDRRCASVWSAGQGRLLEALESRARDGCVFVAVT